MKVTKVLSGIWEVIYNLFVLTVIIAIFSKASSDFERIVFSILVMIYLTIVSQGKYQVLIFNGEHKTQWIRFKYLRKILKFEPIGEEKEIEEEQEKELEEKTRMGFTFWVNGVFLFIFYLIAVFNLIGAALFSSY